MTEDEFIERVVQIINVTHSKIEGFIQSETACDALNLMRDEIITGVRSAFIVPEIWRAKEHRSGSWSVYNTVLREYYTTAGRNNSRRIVPFKTRETAMTKAYQMNKAALS